MVGYSGHEIFKTNLHQFLYRRRFPRRRRCDCLRSLLILRKKEGGFISIFILPGIVAWIVAHTLTESEIKAIYFIESEGRCSLKSHENALEIFQKLC